MLNITNFCWWYNVYRTGFHAD